MTPPRHGEGDRAVQRRGGGGVPKAVRPQTVLARKLRRTMTLPEVMLWQALRGKMTGVKFRRQHPVGPYIADFYCSAHQLVIEVDGEAHNRGTRPGRDAVRDRFMKDNGYHVMRLNASDILRDVQSVASAIAALVAAPLHHQPEAGGPPPRAGEDEA